MDITSLLFPLLILLLFIPIFLSGRRQRRQIQEMKDLQGALEPGDVVMTTSGLRATVVDASYEETVDLEIADGVITTWVRAAVKEKVVTSVDDPAVVGGAHDSALDPAHDTADGVTTPHRADLADVPDRPLSLDKDVSLEKDDSANGSSRA